MGISFLMISHPYNPCIYHHSLQYTQYPAMFVLMIITAVNGYVQPYKHHAANILETVLSVNTLVLLLLRNTATIEEALGNLGEQAADSQLSTCQDNMDGVTDFVWLLQPAYYLPLVLLCAVGATWISMRLK